MLNIIKADLYRYARRPFIYITAIVLIICSALVPILATGILNINIIAPIANRSEMVSLAGCVMSMLLPVMMVFSEIMSEDYQDGTLKNILVSDISKTKFFLGKFIIQIILAVVISTICITVFLLFINIIPPDEMFSIALVKGFILKFISSIPLFIAGIAIVNLLVVIFKKTGIVCIIYYFIFMQIRIIIIVLEKVVSEKFGAVREIMISNALENLGFQALSNTNIINALVLGLAYTILITSLSIFLFKRQEVK